MRTISVLALSLASLVPAIAHAQLLRPFRSYSVPHQVFNNVCPGGTCEIVTQPITVYGNNVSPSTLFRVEEICGTPVTTFPFAQPEIKQLSTPEGIEEVDTAVADGPHTRAMVSGSCGSGTICGADESGSYVLSNAHVWGTQIGKLVTIDIVSNGRTLRLTGRTIFAGYSSTRMVDFCIAKFEGLTSLRYMKLLKTEPADGTFATTGSPRCVWPLVTKEFNNPRNYGDGLITGSPDAIGGQSGSAIYNSKGQQIALLTWSISGRCAGQKTSKLWQVATERDVTLADPRPEGLEEVLDLGENRPVTEEGVFGEIPARILKEIVVRSPLKIEEGLFGELPLDTALTEKAGEGNEIVGPHVRPLTENTISSVANSAMEDMPIWYVEGQPDPDPTPDPGTGDCYKLTDKEWALIQFIRAQSQEAGFGDLLKGIDWVALAKTIIEIIKLFQTINTNSVSSLDIWQSPAAQINLCLSA